MPLRSSLGIVFFFVAVACWPAWGIETVRVDSAGGAPRLVVDGKPVRARMFFGIQGAQPLPVGTEETEISFEFTPTEDEPARATMHFRFGHQAGNVYLDDLRVTDLETGRDVIALLNFEPESKALQRWQTWPVGVQNTVGTLDVQPGKGRNGSSALHVALQDPPGKVWPDYHLYHRAELALNLGHRHRVTFWAQADRPREITVAFYRPGQPYVYLGGPPGPMVSQIRLAAEVGVDFVSFPVGLPWPQPGQAVDWSSVDSVCETVLKANPGALLLPRIGMGAPPWWRAAHPGAAMVWDRPGEYHNDVVVASPEYRRDAAERLAALVAHLEERFGPSVAGYHPCGQNTGEWFYQDTWTAGLNGYAPADRDAFRRWLTERYGSDAALQSAWNQPGVTLAGAEVPSPESRRAAPAGTLRDPVAERALLDFTEFQQKAMADLVCDLARAVRQASQGRKLVVFFYGYVFEFAAVRNGPATAGHYALRQVLDSPDIDVLCSPISYFDRALGESGPAMTAAESVALAGKMWLYEDDTSTYLSSGTQPGHQDRVADIDQTNALLLRNTAQCALRNFATWWMDLGATGWFNDARMWAEMRRLAALDEPLLSAPRPFRPDVAAVIDERSMQRVAFDGQTLTRPGVYEVRRALGRMGTSYGQYLLDDVTAGRVDARMLVFLTPWCLDAEQRAALKELTRDRLAIWCYAPGCQEPAGPSPDALRALTGFRLERVAPESAWAEPTEAGRQAGLSAGWGVKQPVQPLFAAVDAAPEETLARYADGSPAVALRRVGEGWSLFVGPPGLTSELLRAAARRASVPLITETDCNVVANGPFVLLHASSDGPLALNTGHPGPVIDLLTGQTLGSGPRLALPIRRGETRVLRLDGVGP